MSFPDFPTHPLLDFCETNRPSGGVNSHSLFVAGFVPLLLRSGFMTDDMHRWCEMELDYYNWTMQIVWFNDVEDRNRFVSRFIYPGWLLWQNDHTHGIQLSSANNDALNEVISQMQYLGAGFTRDMHLFRAEGLAEPFEWDKIQDEYPTKDHMWMGATEHQAMIAKMCGLETFVTPSLREVGADIKGVTREQGAATQARRLLGKYGVTLKPR